jgi:hypothetical protein
MTDKINQLGRYLKESKDTSDRALARNHPKVRTSERVRDVFDSTIPFKMVVKKDYLFDDTTLNLSFGAITLGEPVTPDPGGGGGEPDPGGGDPGGGIGGGVSRTCGDCFCYVTETFIGVDGPNFYTTYEPVDLVNGVEVYLNGTKIPKAWDNYSFVLTDPPHSIALLSIFGNNYTIEDTDVIVLFYVMAYADCTGASPCHIVLESFDNRVLSNGTTGFGIASSNYPWTTSPQIGGGGGGIGCGITDTFSREEDPWGGGPGLSDAGIPWVSKDGGGLFLGRTYVQNYVLHTLQQIEGISESSALYYNMPFPFYSTVQAQPEWPNQRCSISIFVNGATWVSVDWQESETIYGGCGLCYLAIRIGSLTMALWEGCDLVSPTPYPVIINADAFGIYANVRGRSISYNMPISSVDGYSTEVDNSGDIGLIMDNLDIRYLNICTAGVPGEGTVTGTNTFNIADGKGSIQFEPFNRGVGQDTLTLSGNGILPLSVSFPLAIYTRFKLSHSSYDLDTNSEGKFFLILNTESPNGNTTYYTGIGFSNYSQVVTSYIELDQYNLYNNDNYIDTSLNTSPIQNEVWYDFKVLIGDGDQLKAKLWETSTDEPVDWEVSSVHSIVQPQEAPLNISVYYLPSSYGTALAECSIDFIHFECS